MKEHTQSIRNLEELALDMIRFLQKWALWEGGVSIYTNGNRYAYSEDESYQGAAHVEVMEGVSPEVCTTGLTRYVDSDGNPLCKERHFNNSEHIFDMIYNESLVLLLRYHEYEVRGCELSEEAWDYIFERYLFEERDFYIDYLYEQYECCDAEELLYRIQMNLLYPDDYIDWDPLVFDTWEEYQNLVSGADPSLTPHYQRYATYAEYQSILEGAEEMSVVDVMPLWEIMVEEAKERYKKECKRFCRDVFNLPTIADYLFGEFMDLFESYGLWCKLGSRWLTCYRIDH